MEMVIAQLVVLGLKVVLSLLFRFARMGISCLETYVLAVLIIVMSVQILQHVTNVLKATMSLLIQHNAQLVLKTVQFVQIHFHAVHANKGMKYLEGFVFNQIAQVFHHRV